MVTGVFPEPTHVKQMYPAAASSVGRGPATNSALNNAQFYSSAPDSSVSLNPNKFQDYDPTGHAEIHYAYKEPSTRQAHEPSYTAAKDTYRDGKSSVGFDGNTFGEPHQASTVARTPKQHPPATYEQPRPQEPINDSFGPVPGSSPTKRKLICGLRIELDGANTEEITVYDGDDPALVVREFARKVNLSTRAAQQLHRQILDQVKAYQELQMRKRNKMY
jgi:hypothetical protein